jgi:glycosyltransferase involved in cell wall biosynthesis
MLIKPEKKDLISVILPVYNAANFITDAVDSVLSQTHSLFECVVINDGSNDGTAEKLMQYKNNRRVRLIERENKGLVRTLNEAIEVSEGNYIMRMDADDLCLPTRMARQLAFLKTNRVDIIGSAIKTFGGVYRHTRRYFSDNETIKFQLVFASCFAHPSLFCRREVLLQNHYDSRYEKIEDYELWTRLAMQGYKMGNCPDVLLHYRVHKGQVTSASRNYQDNERIKIAKRYSRWYFTSDVYDKALHLLLNRNFNRLSDDQIAHLNNFYMFLKETYPAQQSIVDYHFFLCMVHNYFPMDVPVAAIHEFSYLKKTLLKTCNRAAFFKKLPVKLYRAMA